MFIGLLIKRHSGVLGLTALVESCPYTVPAWLPEVLHELAQQMNEEMTIRVRTVQSDYILAMNVCSKALEHYRGTCLHTVGSYSNLCNASIVRSL